MKPVTAVSNHNAMQSIRPHILEMAGYTPGEQPQTGKFIKLNTNENPYPPSARVVQAIQEAAETALVRYPDATATSFRQRAADVLGVDPDWILCGNGSDDILTILTRAFVGQGDLLRLPYPSYVLYKTLAKLQGARSEEVSFQDDWNLPAAFAAASDGLKLAFLPNPNSPSGTVMNKDDLRRLAAQMPCPLLIDEAYVDFADDHCLDLVREFEHVMVSRTLSKSYALAGLRFGFLVAQPQVIAQLAKVKDSYNCDALAIAGATAAIDDQEWLMENRRKVIATRQRLHQALEQLGFSVIPSQANFLWCKHPQVLLEPVYQQLKSHRVLVRYMNYAQWSDGIRISVGTDDQIDALLSLLPTMI